MAMSGAGEGGLLKRVYKRLAATDAEVEAESLQSHCSRLGATLIEDAGDREIVSVAGTVRSVTLRPVGGVPALEADVYDGSGAVTVVFLGRRQVAGIKPGVMMGVEGRLARSGTRATIYNPAYTLYAAGKHA
jgi:hypothetical protein